MKIINYLNFNEILIKKYYKYFLLGKDINLINDIEELIIKYLNKNTYLKISRLDLNLKIQISELHRKFIIKDIFDYTNLIILQAPEILLNSAPIKKILILFNNILPKNYYLIIKTHILTNDIYSNLLIEETIFSSINPLIINCKINNDINEFKSWLLLRTKYLQLNISENIYKYLYLLYENDVKILSNILNILAIDSNNIINFINLNKILFIYERYFTIYQFFKYLYQGDLYIIVYKLFILKYNLKEDILLNIIYELQSYFSTFTKKLLNYKYNKHKSFISYENNNKFYYLDKIMELISLNKLYLIIKLLNNIEVDMLYIVDKCQFISDKIINIIIVLFTI